MVYIYVEQEVGESAEFMAFGHFWDGYLGISIWSSGFIGWYECNIKTMYLGRNAKWIKV